jgi:hypothetical protein
MNDSSFRMALVALAVLIQACTGGGEETSADDQERPVDWAANWTLQLQPDDAVTDRDVLRVVAFESDQSLNALSDEVFAMAFSGEGQVYAPDIFGGMDHETKLDPKALLEHLKVMDTVTIEDIYTGQQRDTVVDNSFTADKVSAMIISFTLDPKEGSIGLSASHLALGVQVFDPITAKRRGDAKRFYMQFEESGKQIDHLKVYTDSLGNFSPAYFEVYPDETSMSLKDWVVKHFGAEATVELKMRVELSFRDGLMQVRDVVISPSSNDPV